jgi:hypothetical protein
MPKNKAAAKGNSKAPTKPLLKKTASSKNKPPKPPKKAAAPQRNNKSKGGQKRAAEESDDESSGEEPEPRPRKKYRVKEKVIDEDEVADELDDDEAMQVDEDGGDGPRSDSEVLLFLLRVTVN